MEDEYSKAISRVRRPSRYLGGERNIIIKDPGAVSMSIALAFPDLYEMGMSNMGMAILYNLLNADPRIAAERVFAPWPDMAAELKKRGLPLTALESGRPLKQFDILGFALPFELCYTNIVQMLDLSGIEPMAEKRGEALPLVIAGGPQAANPEPIAELFDAVLFGEGEDIVPRLCHEYILWRREGGKKEDLLKAWAGLPGVYVPRFYKPRYNARGELEGIDVSGGAPARVRRVYVSDLDAAPFPTCQLVPFAKPVHDRINLEIARGCTRGCRFCQAGMIYRPARERSPEKLLQILKQALKSTGHEDVSLLSLSSGDYSVINQLIARLMRDFSPEHVSVSMPSLRVESLNSSVINEIKRVRKTGFTIAPEAASPRLQRVINKNIPIEEVLRSVEKVFTAGWNGLKLYFMIGLPTETYEDVHEIARLAHDLLRAARSIRRVKNLSISISPHVPKPHTPFQWTDQLTLEEMKARLDILMGKIKGRSMQLKWQDPRISFIETVFSRGDRRLLPAVMRAYELGCLFDGWTDQFRWDLWQRAFADSEIDVESYLRGRKTSAALPWDHLDSGVRREFLIEEYNRALTGEPTFDCRAEGCRDCGVCEPQEADMIPPLHDENYEIEDPEPEQSQPEPQPVSKFRYRVQYTKEGRARFLGHLEIVRVWHRTLRRTGLPIAFSKGFHKKPIISFGHALPVGVESFSEYIDFETVEAISDDEVKQLIASELPEWLQVKSVSLIQLKAPPISASIIREKYEISGGLLSDISLEEAEGRLEDFRKGKKIVCVLHRKNGIRAFDVNPSEFNVEALRKGAFLLDMQVTPQEAPNPAAVLTAVLGLEMREDAELSVTKLDSILNR